MKALKGQVVAKIDVPPVVVARLKSGLSQSELAGMINVTVCTPPRLEARPQTTIAQQQPKVLKKVFKHLEEV